MERESKELAPPSAWTAKMSKPLPLTHRGATQERKARWAILAVLAWGRGWGLYSRANSDNEGHEGDFISVCVTKQRISDGIGSRRKVDIV